MISAINGEPHSHVEKSARSQHLLNLRFSFDLWTLVAMPNRRRSIRLPLVGPEIERLPSSREKGREEVQRSTLLPHHPPFTLSLSPSLS